ncbi:unnamed protein product [Adineta ricciae]|uniref:Gag-like protein n=1 Tax=Adineta ricciae TaxID=249248 RepID=A0A815KN57_ADIRI|nr:unnamed protein product [Adineta ricciae]CAF1395766.1 unnamed protein product [Adineta ricciae]
MSGEPKIFKSNDGSQIIYDTVTGKWYSLQLNSSPNSSSNFTQLSMNQDSRKTVSKASSVRTNTQVTHKNSTVSKTSVNQHQTKQQKESTWKDDPSVHTFQHAPITMYNEEQNNTPILLEQNVTNLFGINEKSDDSYMDGEAPPDPTKRSLNTSDDFTLVKSNKVRKNEHDNEIKWSPLNKPSTTTNAVADNLDNQHEIPLEHIQRAVVHNLPCFSISFFNSAQFPSAVAASDALYGHFEKKKVQLSNRFSVVRYIGHQLKIGVNDKEDYLKLCDVRVWPAEIQGQKISITMPKFTPDQFSLVVRNVPQEFAVEHVMKEVKKSATSVDKFRMIVYPYQRETNDFRFIVSDLKEYNGLINLGHIGVGNKLCSITPYRPANKMTFCNKCWRVGHIRSKCSSTEQKCRFCLQEYKQGHNEICTKQYKCAQCHQEHYSLNANCEVIREYRANLNRAVKKATAEGKIKLPQADTQQSSKTQQFKPALDSFPPLPGASEQQVYKPTAWRTTAPTPTQIFNQTSSVDITNQELYDKICSHLDAKMSKIHEQIADLESKTKENEKTGLETRQNVSNLLELVKLVITDVIPPLVRSAFRKGSKVKKAVEKTTAHIKDKLDALSVNMEIDGMSTGEMDKEDDQEQVEKPISLET